MLPRVEEDGHWVPAIALEDVHVKGIPTKLACFTLVHPACLQIDWRLIGSYRDRVGTVMIGHLLERGLQEASHQISEVSPGEWSVSTSHRTSQTSQVEWRKSNGKRILDARWNGRQRIGNCKGYCFLLCNIHVDLKDAWPIY